MNQAPKKVYDVVTPVVEGLGYELIGIEWLPQGGHSLLRVYIDTESGIGLEDCQQVSHQLSAVLDVEDVVSGQYRLEVSSPGIDRPLFTEAHFEQFIGSGVKLTCSMPINGQRKFKGVIDSVIGTNLKLAVDDEVLDISIQNIQKANLFAQ
ncbi:MAG: ribosome maturation factor RimP [Thiohalomonadales bacterium]